MTDHIYLSNMTVDVHIGAGDGERADEQPIEVDVDMTVDLKPAGEADDLAPGLLAEAAQEVIGQQHHVAGAFAKRGHLDRDNVDSIVQVLPEFSLGHELR